MTSQGKPMNRSIFFIAGLSALAAGILVTDTIAAPIRGNIVDDFRACRRITEAAARVTCYDNRIDKLDAANDKEGVVVLDRQQVREARRSLFGFPIPKLPFLQENSAKPDKKSEESEAAIDSTIRSVRQLSANEWKLVLDDGAVWQTTEAPNTDPSPGDAIHIKHAVLGSYLANIHGQRAVRIRRIG